MSSSRPKVNLRSTAVKRIMQEAAELGDSNEDDFVAAPLESDIFEWHCTMRGVPESEYDGGLYHLRILLPPSYPMSAPDIILLTPNGRFELGKKICIDGLTSFHAGSWQPAWGVRTAILGLRSFWMQTGEALSAIGALDYSKEERRRLAKLSREWVCPTCGTSNHALLPPKTENQTATDVAEGSRSGAVDVPEDLHPEPVTAPERAIALQPEADRSIGEAVERIADAVTSSNAPAVPPVSRPAAIASPPPTRTTQITPPRPRTPRRSSPIWLDALIFTALSLMLLLIARRLAKATPEEMVYLD